MILKDAFERFVKAHPVAVMARALMERALEPEALDALFRTHAKRQYEKELLFSTLVDVMAVVVCGKHPSVRQAYAAMHEQIPVSLTALYAKIDLTRVDAPPPYDVLIDRISHDVPSYQPVLKVAHLAGTRVVNNPFWRIADDKAIGTALAKALGVAVPKTWILPSKAHGDDVSSESLHNLRYPLSWEEMAREAGFPMYVKPHWGGGFRDVTRVASMEELLRAYDRSGRLTLIAQESIEWSSYVRCVCVGKADVLVLPWDPRLPHHLRYTGARESMPALSEGLVARCAAEAETLCRALGYDMNTVEFAIRDGVPYAIDFMNCAPDADLHSVGEENFRWIVTEMAETLVERAFHPAPWEPTGSWPKALGLAPR